MYSSILFTWFFITRFMLFNLKNYSIWFHNLRCYFKGYEIYYKLFFIDRSIFCLNYYKIRTDVIYINVFRIPYYSIGLERTGNKWRNVRKKPWNILLWKFDIAGVGKRVISSSRGMRYEGMEDVRSLALRLDQVFVGNHKLMVNTPTSFSWIDRLWWSLDNKRRSDHLNRW